MKIQLFNPGHDIALASGLAHFTAPHAARQLHADLGYLPALWADGDDGVLVDHVEAAALAWRRMANRCARVMGIDAFRQKDVCFLTSHDLARQEVTAVDPWGWDLPLVNDLVHWGVGREVLPAADVLEHYRQCSHRRMAARLLPRLRLEGTVGEAFECHDEDEVRALLNQYGEVVLKAPWSSSGRGVRFVNSARFDQYVVNWMRRVITQQGAVMVEPFYSKVKDFGMEFYADGKGGIRYEGLSLFHTVNGAYVGNILATEHAKREMIGQYLSVDLLERVIQGVQHFDLLHAYHGPFGVDMMVVRDDGALRLHPCVEINLRRTMGHVALAMTPTDDEVRGVMRIDYDNHYKLKISKL